MADQPAGEKVLPASPRKIQQARERGNVAKSQDLNAGVTLFMALLGVWLLGPLVFRQLLALTHYYFADAHAILLSPGQMPHVLWQATVLTAPAVVPIMLLMLAGGILSNYTQFGLVFAPQALQPKIERLDPIRGFRRFISLRGLVELAKSIGKLAGIGLVAYFALRNRLPELVSLMHMGPGDGSAAVWGMILDVWWRIALAVLAIGIADFAYQRWQYMEDLRMTRREAQDELKQLEGDPRVRERIRQLQRRLAMQRMMAEVPEAEVVITNPVTYAVALRYNPGEMDAPKVVAKGARVMAERIRDLAVVHDVPIVERPDLARTLYRTLEIGQGVPENLFRAVAEVLAYVYEIDQRESKRLERAAVAAGAPAA